MVVVTKDGEMPITDAAAKRIMELEAEVNGLVNLVVALVRRGGGESTTIEPVEIATNQRYTLTSSTTPTGIALRVVEVPE